MLVLNGKYNSAKVFTDNIEQEAISQIIELLNQEWIKDSNIRIMPDVHAGKGCTIGFTMTIKDKVCPNLVGVDIGCGVMVQPILFKKDKIDWNKINQTIETFIPSGMNIRTHNHSFLKNVSLDNLCCKQYIDLERAKKSLGTLGGGNHFIEINKDDSDQYYLVVHTGSRYLGKQIAECYQRLAVSELSTNSQACKDLKENTIKKLKAAGKSKEIEKALNKINEQFKYKGNIDLAYLSGESMQNYLHDMSIAQQYAFWNRSAIIDEIISHLKDEIIVNSNSSVCSFDTMHNYIDINSNILRKGAISADKNKLMVIPINMRDGSLICKGKGNPEWNYSAPHGAGRIMSRSKAKENISLDEFKEIMKDVNSFSVLQSTLDEAPQAYKNINEIKDNIQDTVEIIHTIKPVFNFKAH